ncbi:hypothetical protein GLW36_12665 [Halorubrum terrestre]|uniref:DUF1102 domain-containing protein n=1 Tax=Halorubrum distributum TaxID=29283 RepID=A0A6B1IG58_9EURY|nr:hypothetical protein [Halorubrum terrestre]MYL17491.1 hypothetical protein [Halorubrum terrestre]
MKLNRRSVLGAIGLVGVGTGAAFGSGAFTSTTAERAVEVNVFGADAGTEGTVPAGEAENAVDEQDENDIGNTIIGNSIDVLVDTSPESVAVRARNGDEDIIPGNELFPVDATTGGYSDLNDNYVSLVANDVRIVFGPNGVPPNSTLTFGDLFGFVESSGTTGSSTDFDVTFGDVDANPSQGQLLTKVDGKTVSTGATVEVTGSGTSPVDGTVESGTTSQETENLTIEIKEQTQDS